MTRTAMSPSALAARGARKADLADWLIAFNNRRLTPVLRGGELPLALMARACVMGRACWPVSHELLLTTDGGGETSSAAEAEQWLRRLGRALLTAQTTSKARQAFDAAGVPENATCSGGDTIDCVHFARADSATCSGSRRETGRRDEGGIEVDG